MTARGIHSCCPEAPSTINVTHNTVEIDGTDAFWIDEQYTGADVSARLLTLNSIPFSSQSVQVALNSGVQRINVDFTVYANKILFTFDPAPSDIIHVQYVRVGTGYVAPVSADLPTGTLVGYATSAIAPAGWKMMDGVSKVYDTIDAALYAFLTVNSHLRISSGSDLTGNFYVLKNITTSYYDGLTFVAGNTIIKT